MRILFSIKLLSTEIQTSTIVYMQRHLYSIKLLAQSAVDVEYTDCISAEG